jgi:hypothetical protein
VSATTCADDVTATGRVGDVLDPAVGEVAAELELDDVNTVGEPLLDPLAPLSPPALDAALTEVEASAIDPVEYGDDVDAHPVSTAVAATTPRRGAVRRWGTRPG